MLLAGIIFRAGRGIRITLLLYCVISVHGMGASRGMRVIWEWIQHCSLTLTSGSTFQSPLAIISSLWGEQGRMICPSLSPPFHPSGLLQQFLRIFNPLWMLRKAQFCCCFPGLLSVAYRMFRVKNEFSRKVILKSSLRADSQESIECGRK